MKTAPSCIFPKWPVHSGVDGQYNPVPLLSRSPSDLGIKGSSHPVPTNVSSSFLTALQSLWKTPTLFHFFPRSQSLSSFTSLAGHWAFLSSSWRKVPYSTSIEDLYDTNQSRSFEQQHEEFFIDPRRLDIRHVPSPEPQQDSNSQEDFSTFQPQAQSQHQQHQQQLLDFPEVEVQLPQSLVGNASQSHHDFLQHDLQAPHGAKSPHGPDVPQVICQQCDRSFPRPSLLKRHLKSHEPPFKCTSPGCSNNGFRDLKSLTRHCQEQHLDQSRGSVIRFFCPHIWCKYSREAGKKDFARAEQLVRHMKTHFKGSR
ncbi:hypothetical protein VTL71DRAFT_11036, partial [Oculimacula yallundae]